MSRTALIYNPTAGLSRTRRFIDDLAGIFRGAGQEVDLHPTESADEATSIARDMARHRSVERIFTVGGDGTLRAAAEGLVGSDVALAPLPAGTTNVVARTLGLPLAPRQAALALTNAGPRPCDVGLCIDGSGAERVFLMQTSLGLDAAVMAGVPSSAKNLVGRLGVAAFGFPIWWRYDYPTIRFRADGGDEEAAVHLVANNIARYGGDFLIAPDAGFDTRHLHLVSYTRRGRLGALTFAVALVRGRHLELPGARCRTISELRVEPPLEAPLQLDGDALAPSGPLTIRLAEARLNLLFPHAESSS